MTSMLSFSSSALGLRDTYSLYTSSRIAARAIIISSSDEIVTSSPSSSKWEGREEIILKKRLIQFNYMSKLLIFQVWFHLHLFHHKFIFSRYANINLLPITISWWNQCWIDIFLFCSLAMAMFIFLDLCICYRLNELLMYVLHKLLNEIKTLK